MGIAKFFSKKKTGKLIEDKSSPNGEYRLVISSFSTKKGCWDYTQGLVYRARENKPIFEVRRNYASFPYSWINHPNGNQYLVCGADYQGQTVLDLTNIKRLDFIPPEAKQGSGFCWVSHRFDVSTKTLVVCGCVWACPYEFRFYDFSDPMKGWPEITYAEDSIEDWGDEKWPTFEPDGTIKTYDTRPDYDEDENEKPVLRSTKTFSRDGLKLRLLNEDVTAEEKVYREKRAEAERLYNEKMKNFVTNDPLYLAHVNLLKDKALSPESHYGIGITHEDWCPHFKEKEQRFCQRVVTSKKITIDLEWGMTSGPIKLIIYKKGKHVEDKWFDHSENGMYQAFKTIKEEIK